VSDLFGGARTETLEVAWGLATGDPDADLAEAEEMLAEGRHRLFKIKVGARDPNADVARVEAVIGAIGTRAGVRIDANQAWDEPVARRAIERLEAAGVELIEQITAHDKGRCCSGRGAATS
jgi:muconate cycloisomerase